MVLSMATDDAWITWSQAAELVGCPVPTIDWNTRQGRIERRPHLGSRPTLKRSSVLEFAARRRAAQQERAGRRRRVRSAPAGPEGWLTTREAAARLDMSADHMRWLVRRGELIGIVQAGRVWIDPDSVDQLAAERSRWVSTTQAAEIVGCSPALIADVVQRGEISQRKLGRAYPSLELESVMAWAEQRRDRLAERDQQRDARRYQRRLAGRPDLDHTWLTVTQAGELLGVTGRYVSMLAREDRLPFTLAGGQRWYREDHLRMWLAARRLERDHLER